MATFTGSPLTGSLTGTNQADTFTGVVNLVSSLPESLSGTGIINANIQALGGNDTIEGSGTVQVDTSTSPFPPLDVSSAIAYGVSNSYMNASCGNDIITISGTGSGVSGSFSLPGRDGTGIGYGVYQSSIDGGSGNDSISIRSSGTGFGGYPGGSGTGIGYGVYQSSIDGGSGNDSISIKSSGTGSVANGSRRGGTGTSYGVASGSVNGGNGDDTIEISGTGRGNSTADVAIGFSTGIGYGLYQASVDSGNGNDTITISGIASASGSNATATAYGISQALVKGGRGDDIIRITGSSTSTGSAGSDTGYGVYQASVEGGDGNDTITITGTANSNSNSKSFLFSNFDPPAPDLIQINSNAEFINSLLRLTPDKASQAGSAFFKTPFPLNNDTSFSTQFQFLIGGQRAGTTEGGDGLVFMLQNDQRATGAIGRDGSGLGYGEAGTFGGNPIANSIGIAFDTFPYQLNNQGSVQILQNGSNSPLAESILPFDFAGGNPLNAWVDYNGRTDLLEVFLAPDTNKPTDPVLSYTTTLTNTVGSQGLFGFSASTGARFNTHDIKRWQLSLSSGNTGTGIGVYQSSVEGGNGHDTINISGTNFGIKDALISGGNGDDTFNVGTGQGTVDGGKGKDKIYIDYFQLDSNHKPTNVQVITGDCDTVLIMGKTDNLGDLEPWTQTIKGVEQFLVNGITYTSSQFVRTFG